MTRREPRYNPAEIVRDIPRDSAIPRYTRPAPAPVTFVEPYQYQAPDDDTETVDHNPLPEQRTPNLRN